MMTDDHENQLSAFRPVQTLQVSIGHRLKCAIWAFVNQTAYRMLPNYFRGWRRFLLRCFGAKVAGDASPHRLSVITNPWNMAIGSQSSLGKDCWIYALDRIEIGDKCCIGNEVKLITGSHDVSACDFRLVTRPIVIGSAVWIANGSWILPGVCIGSGAVVGACAVVTKDIPPWTVVAGNPAKIIKKRELKVHE